MVVWARQARQATQARHAGPARPAGGTAVRRAACRLPRSLHPIAWWVWAIGLATAVYRTTNPLLLLLVLAVLGYVVTARHSDAPWARGFRYYLALASAVIAVRVVFRAVFGGGVRATDHILVRLPRIPLPSWYTGVQLGGPVSLEAVVAAGVDGLRLACLLCCVGAANSLANPKRALRILPGALYELGVAVTVSISVAPQLVDSVQRVRRARRLRAGSPTGVRALHSIAIPVLQDALDRSLLLAASMDSRGYGRSGGVTRGTRRLTATLLLGGMLGLCLGAYGLFDAGSSRVLGTPAILAGGGLCCAGIALGGRRVRRTSYRPDRWRLAETVVAGCGLTTAAVLFASSGFSAADVNPSLYPLRWPPLPLLPTLAVLLAVLPAFVAPPSPRAPSSLRAPSSPRAASRRPAGPEPSRLGGSRSPNGPGVAVSPGHPAGSPGHPAGSPGHPADSPGHPAGGAVTAAGDGQAQPVAAMAMPPTPARPGVPV